MARKNINLGTPPNGDDGMDARSAFEVCQENFAELYGAALPDDEAQRAAARARFGLGAAALRNVGTNTGNMLEVGAGGWLGRAGNDTYMAGYPSSIEENVTQVYRRVLPEGGVSGYAASFHFAAIDTWGRVRIAHGQQRAWVQGGLTTSGGWSAELLHTGNASALPITSNLSPATDNTASYGTAARRPTQLFAATATIGTSDAREKTPVRELTEAEYAVGLQLAREIGAYRWLEAVERKGEGARQHFGQTVQRAMEIFRDHGLDPFAYGAICYDSWEQETIKHPAEYEQIEIPAVLDEQGNEIQPARYEQGALIREAWTEVTSEAGDRYSWRDSELFWLICAAQQRQADELARQQADILQRLEALEQSA